MCVAAVLALTVSMGGQSAPQTFKVAFYNIRSGKGIQPLRGHVAPFAETDNCADRSRPVNAWGAGVVQRELVDRLGSDRAVIALGLTEAWHCASPEQVRAALGWKSHTGERNGTALVARYGTSGTPRWVQLDTSQNKNPKDTMWVVGASVCLDASCTKTVDVYATHWAGSGPNGPQVFDKQAADTVTVMSASKGPHVLLGDLNVFEGTSEVCHQRPNNQTLAVLRQAGYVDAWPKIHPDAPGFTGMVNRAGCGRPEGTTWKRIDYAWSRGVAPIGIEQFGVPSSPGDAGASDHYGIVVEYPVPR
jgi:endonuclease/exonuclease/phosphatase family metal-dependent hydrolase